MTVDVTVLFPIYRMIREINVKDQLEKILHNNYSVNKFKLSLQFK